MSSANGRPSTGDALRDPRSESRHARTVALGCTLAVFFIAVVDYATGIEARVFPLYYLPISLGSLRVSRSAGLRLAALSTALWVLAMWWGGSPWTADVFIFNTVMQTLSFGLIAVLVANLANRFEREHDLSRTDILTSLPNSRAFHELAEVLVAGAHRYGRPFTIAYLDLDNFKQVNDKQGHAKGDLVLQRVAAVLRRATRASDVAARLGGDEFVLLMPDTGPGAARTVLQRVRDLIAREMKSSEWPVTASIGAISFLEAPTAVEEAIQAADSLMYRVKQAGKNQLLLEIVGSEAQPVLADHG